MPVAATKAVMAADAAVAKAADADAVAEAVAADLRPGDAITVKGSLGTRLSTVVEAIRARARPEPVATGADPEGADPEGADPRAGRRYYYQSHRDQRRSTGIQEALLEFTVPALGDWAIASYGPDEERSSILGGGGDFTTDSFIPYDPTNGTISGGDIVRSQASAEGRLTPGQ